MSPVRDFECQSCGHKKLDHLTFGRSTTIPMCPECGQLMVMLYSSYTPVFKGEGFHCNDYPDDEFARAKEADYAFDAAREAKMMGEYND